MLSVSHVIKDLLSVTATILRINNNSNLSHNKTVGMVL